MRECPDRLYKYRDLSGTGLGFLERTILHHEIYLPSPKSFNDPFDCMPDFNMQSTVEDRVAMYKRALTRLRRDLSLADQEKLAVHLANNPVVDPASEEARLTMQRLHDEQIRGSIGVYCVTEHPDNLLMWSHYAASHTGVCLEFDSAVIPFAIAQDVKYQRARAPVNRAAEADETSMEKTLLTKSDDWAYEHEWRVVEYQQGPGVYEIPESALTGVILGARISRVHEEQIVRWVSQRSSRIPLYRSVPSTTDFRVTIEPYSPRV